MLVLVYYLHTQLLTHTFIHSFKLVSLFFSLPLSLPPFLPPSPPHVQFSSLVGGEREDSYQWLSALQGTVFLLLLALPQQTDLHKGTAPSI